MDQAAPTDQEVLRGVGRCRQDPELGRHLHLRSGRDCQKAAGSEAKSLHNFTGAERDPVRESLDSRSIYDFIPKR